MESPLFLAGRQAAVNRPAPLTISNPENRQWPSNPRTPMVKGSLMADPDRQIGELTADVRTLRETVAELRAEIKQLREEFSQVRGGWKVVVTMAALAGGALSWATSFFLGKH